ncbi:uncharacterized protein (DUF58 family) [Conyzicola lurida]|uniref:Uncharacterized protein (DUF58 family) n=1 Tax=Conyzicola lurida TaxID=1172621 RepID=A0A841ALU6_9MICO|nr:uncharacterized protein (DUF58 family) [Conyzicola lurida]
MTLRPDSQYPTATEGLTNARTRLVGNRTGIVADTVIVGARFARALRDVVGLVAVRAASVVTPLGWFVLASIPLSLLVGYGLGWIELVVAGFAGLVLVAVAILYLVGRNAVAIRLDVTHSRVVVGQNATGHVVVRNPGSRRTLGITVEVPVAHGLAELAVPSLPRDGESVQEFSIPTRRRGVVAVGPVRTVRADPIGLVRRELVWTDTQELFIHPRTIGIPSMSAGLVRDLEGQPTRDLSSSDIAFHALREYLPGDERRNIHWKSTAKTGTYMVRQFEQTRRSHIVIALSLATVDYASDEEFEMAVSVAGSLGSRAIREIREVSVVVSEKTPEFAVRKVFAVRALSTRSRTKLLDELAVVESAETAIAITDVARVAGMQVAGVSVAFLICGSAVTPADLRAASTKFPAGVEVIAVVCDPDAAPRLRSAPGLSVLTIGYLEDLPKSLARVVAV